MTFELPESMDNLAYMTRRVIDKGRVICWVNKELCPKCKKGLMGKPRDPKTGKAKIRSTEYICPECEYTVPKKEYEDTLEAFVIYTCPHCEKSGELNAPFKRKTIMGTNTLRVQCGFCGGNIDITKKMKEPKKKKSKKAEVVDFDDD